MFLRVKEIQDFLMKRFGVDKVTDLKDIDGSYTIPGGDYSYNVVIKDMMLFKEEMTAESQKLYDERKAFSRLMEQRAEELCPGEENYCFHEDKQVVYYGGDWEGEEEDEDGEGGRFFTVEQLTTGYEDTKLMLEKQLVEERKNLPKFSYNDIIDMYRYSKKMGYKDFEQFLNESR